MNFLMCPMLLLCLLCVLCMQQATAWRASLATTASAVRSRSATNHPILKPSWTKDVSRMDSSTLMSTSLQSKSSADEEQDSGNSALYATAGIAGILSNAICAYSLYILKTTSCGLPPGPYGLIGAAEGVSYLVVVATFVWSVVTKVKTGKGLPAGPSGLLGASEGLTFLTILAGVVIAALNYNEYGFLPGFFPDGKCFGGM